MFADCTDVSDNTDAYVIGALDDDEARALAAHLERCADCTRWIEIARGTSHALAFAVPLAAPSASVKARVMAGALALEAAQRKSRPRWPLRGLAAALALIAVGALAWGTFMQHRVHVLSGQNASLRGEVNAADARLSDIDAQLAAASGTANKLSDLVAFNDALRDVSIEPDAESVRLLGTTLAPSAAGRYVWSQSRQLGALEVARLPALAPGMTYELTILYARRTEDGGTFTVDDSGHGDLVVPDTDVTDEAGRPRGFAVIMAPAIKTDDTTDAVVLAGTLTD